ncbi:hypothetical protein FRX31_024321 [Thalictrum thalictroides]|uniref:Uncharacterized protein n=1 Tax=Thalictrum thalictroides TaxID=46969 RepID=A0A7J6VME2_THATH|nr:hypothetical protein FRX31_024321 [Thalictrum thalictroides]
MQLARSFQIAVACTLCLLASLCACWLVFLKYRYLYGEEPDDQGMMAYSGLVGFTFLFLAFVKYLESRNIDAENQIVLSSNDQYDFEVQYAGSSNYVVHVAHLPSL